MQILLDAYYKRSRLWERVDPKLRAALVSGAATYLATKHGIQLDGELVALLTLVVSGAAGTAVPNVGSELRNEEYSGMDAGGLGVAEAAQEEPVPEELPTGDVDGPLGDEVPLAA